ncbi:S9 family peptidase [Sphingomonas colocasiae]|nr:prolyl oligopeptidase family serine peptidase [Sphingomonas colocasiae]
MVKATDWATNKPRWSPDGSRIFVPLWPEDGPASLAYSRKRSNLGEGPKTSDGEVMVYRSIAPKRSSGAEAEAGAGARAGADAGAPQDEAVACAGSSHFSARLAAIAATGGSAKPLISDLEVTGPRAPRRSDPTPYLRTSPSGRWISYLGGTCQVAGSVHDTRMSLYLVPAEGGIPHLVTAGLRPADSGEFDPRYRWSPNRDEIVFLADDKLWRVPVGEEGPGEPVELGKDLTSFAPNILWFSGDGTKILVGSDARANGRALDTSNYDMSLSLVPLDGGPSTLLPFDRKVWTLSSIVSADESRFWQAGGSQLRVMARRKSDGVSAMLALDWSRGVSQPVWQAEARMTRIAPLRAGMIALYEDLRTPPDLKSFSLDMRTSRRLTRVEPGLDGASNVEIATFHTDIPRENGAMQTVRTAIIMPPGTPRNARLPAVIWFYPGSRSTDALQYFGAPDIGDPAYLFTRRGYAVVLADVPLGPGEQRGHVIDEIMDALMPQVYRAADLGYVDINRLALRGTSFGGFATAAVISRTNLFRAAIASSGRYDLAGGYAQPQYWGDRLIDPMGWFERSQPRLGQTLWDDPARFVANSPYFLADRIRTPLLIIQGSADPVGSFEAGKMFAALRRLGREAELAVYAGEGHQPSDWRPKLALDQVERTLDFMDRHLRAPLTAEQKTN